MNLDVEVRPRPDLPDLIGPHELSWSYILDAVFADAYRQRLGELSVVLPAASLQGSVAQREELAYSDDDRQTRGLALLAVTGAVGAITADRLYLLELRRAYFQPRSAPPSEHLTWRLEWSLDVMSLRSRLLGLPIRAALLIGRNDLADRASFLMRRHFAGERPTPSRYRLSAWASTRTRG